MLEGQSRMPVEYTYNRTLNIIDTDAHDIVTVQEIVSYLNQILSDDQIPFGCSEVFSLENASDLIMQYSEMSLFNELWAKYKVRIGNQVLIIAPSKLSYGLFRMLSTVVSMSDPEAEQAFKIFTNRDEVYEFLKSQN